MADLEEAIQVTRQAVEATPKDHPDLAALLNNLGSYLGDRYSRTGAMVDLEEAIQVARQAVEATPKDHPDLARRLNNLGISLSNRYSSTGAITDLEEAIQVARHTVEATPKDHPDLAGLLISLGNRLGDRYSSTGAMTDLEQADSLFFTALHLDVCPPSDRIVAGRRLLTSSDHLYHAEQLYQCAVTTIQLVPLLALRSLENTDKQYRLTQISGLAPDAAAVTLKAGQGSFAAIEMLEIGRGNLASTVYDLRADISALRKHYPQLAERFVHLRDELDIAVPSHNLLTLSENSDAINTQHIANERREASIQLDALIKDIRGQLGLERFLLPPSEDEMQRAAAEGPIVIINISSHSCDAFIIEPSAIRAINLPLLSRDDLQSRHFQSLETLTWLWDAVVCTVLNALGFNETPVNGSWPRVWWIPTGPLVRFPLHAAGNYLNGGSDTALDRVISSYSTSVKAIIYGRQQQSNPGLVADRQVTLVAMEETPGLRPLQFAGKEIDSVQRICESLRFQPVRPELYKNDVLSSLRKSWIFHFAGHGLADDTSPLHSQLFLRDWAQDPLTVQSLLETNIGSLSPFLAYLSACGTGENRNKNLADEGIHLTAACQLAGFRHVVGTLWAVDDKVCVDMAEGIYGVLRDVALSSDEISDGAVSRALHRVMRELRERWVNEIKRDEDERVQKMRSVERDGKLSDIREAAGMPAWIPYVHYGL
ncbi:TPR domain-containing protein [Xylaria arbuscula]|nr:TPR domain-containing protein [Xylaria arbuscula]